MISVLLPTRGRPDALVESVASLRFTADHSEKIEILCAVDADDAATVEVCQEMAMSGGQVRAWIAPQRFGYGRLHEYVNFLASKATGEWLMLWNDDAQMVSPGWDTVIEDTGPGHVLFIDALYPALRERGNIFPVWPRAWYQLLGYVSRSPNVDVWISELGRRLGVEKRIPSVQAVHVRQVLAGDPTHDEGRALMGEGNDPAYDSSANRLERARVVRLLQQVRSGYEN